MTNDELQRNPAVGPAAIALENRYLSRRAAAARLDLTVHDRNVARVDDWYHHAYNRVYSHVYCACSVEQILADDSASPDELQPCAARVQALAALADPNKA